ncbi:MAG TPA: hypothetical protein EYH11_02390 [Sulfurimonas autotrophica]|nr:hypothetical protein [Sulfurimonas autotrophica]
MSVIFSATIKLDDHDKWFIELKDETDGRREICFDMDAFEAKIEELGSDYGGYVDEVKWFKDENVPPVVMDEIRVIMAERRAKVEEERGESITPIVEKKEQ